MPVICGDFGGNLPFTGNLQEVSGLLYPTSTEESNPQISMENEIVNPFLPDAFCPSPVDSSAKAMILVMRQNMKEWRGLRHVCRWSDDGQVGENIQQQHCDAPRRDGSTRRP